MIGRLVVIAGGGSYPRLVVEGAKRAGVAKVDVLAVRGSTERQTRKAADEVVEIGIGEIASGIATLAARGYDGAILAGQVNPLSLFRSRFDERTKQWLAQLPVKTAHSIFGKLIEKFSEAGIKVLPASLYMDGCIPGEGVLTSRGATAQEQADLRHAIEVAGDIGVHDVGQTVMVKSGMVLAVEAFEGTNAALRRGGRLGGKGSVVFKAARRGHDMRFDIPVVGMKTLKVMKRAGATALGFQAGRLIMLEREKVIGFANANGIAIIGFDSGLERAPLRP
jgi:DUF1009 family protein